MMQLRAWIAAYTTDIVYAQGQENSKRPTVVLKAAEGLNAYEDMLVYYAMNRLTAAYGEALPPMQPKAEREWVNVGGQLVGRTDMEQIIADVESGVIGSWQQLHERMDTLCQAYPTLVCAHAYNVLCTLSGTSTLDETSWQRFRARYSEIQVYVERQKLASRKKDNENPYRSMTFWDDAERDAVIE
jgi:hypothetical protein